jgi:hypothetical protein
VDSDFLRIKERHKVRKETRGWESVVLVHSVRLIMLYRLPAVDCAGFCDPDATPVGGLLEWRPFWECVCRCPTWCLPVPS